MFDKLKEILKELKYNCSSRDVCIGCKRLNKCQFKFYLKKGEECILWEQK